MCDNGFFRSEL